MADQLRVLMVEDVEEDALLILRELRVGGFEVVHERVETQGAFQKALAEGTWDLVLADYRLPSYSGLDALKDLKATGQDLPFLLISGTIGEEMAVAAMRAGAHDYLMKGNLGRLVPAVRRELREVEGRRQNRAAQVSLAESEETLAKVFRTSPAAISITSSRDGRFLKANEAFYQLLGWTREEVIGKTSVELGIWAEPESRERMVRAIAVGESPAMVEARVRRKDGQVVDILLSLAPVEIEAQPCVLTVGVEITERKRSEMELRRQSMAIEQAAEMIVITDTDGAILYANPAFEKVTGYPRAEALGQTPRILKSGKHDEAFYREMWQTLTRGETWAGHVTNKRKDGTLYEEECTISPVLDDAGKIINYVAVKRDVTQEMALQAQLHQSQKLETVGQLAAGIAHDFNNLLMVFGGCASLLLKRLPEDTPVRSLIEEIRRAVSRGSGMTQQLLSLSRQQVGHLQPLDLNLLVGEVLKMARHLVLEHVEIVTRPDPLSLWVVADHNQMLQVLMNLVVNARDAMKEGGTLRIETSPCTLDGPDLRFPGAPPGDYAIFAVADTGCGMSPEVQARIFEPFFTTKDRGKGTGLGLAIVHSIVRQSKGYLHVQSRVGEGAEFSILLPRCPVPAVHADPEKADESSLRGTETVLLAEDDSKVRTVVGRILREQGYRVVMAKDGAEAFRCFEANPSRFPILLSDVAMPRLNGLDLARKVRLMDPRVRVILMSGYSDADVMRQVLNEREISFLPKPVDADLLLRRMRESLGTPPVGESGIPLLLPGVPEGERLRIRRRGGRSFRAVSARPPGSSPGETGKQKHSRARSSR
jgi:PAS domain S-box-containing protein